MKSGSKKLTFAFLLFTAAILVGCIGGIVAVSRKNNRRNSIGDVGSEIDPERYNALSDKDKALVDKILAQEEYIESLLSQADELVPIEDAAATKDEIDDEILNTVPSSRGLQGTATYLTPLACNSGIDFNTLPCTSLSSLLPAAGNLQIPCGTCVQVDITDGSTVELPGGLRISGMLHFPPSANVHIRTTSVLVEGTLKIETPTPGNQVKFLLFGVDNVMYTSTEIGSKCEGGCNLGLKPIAVVGGNLDIKGYADGCPSWEKLIYASPVNANELYVSGPAAACWGPGTELVLTSHTRVMDDRQVVTVQSTDPSTGQIVLMEPITKTISLVDNADFAVEIASLNRPVVFEGEPNGVFGGHLIVFHTQTPQHIEGVEIRNFGQQGLLGRYPLHFHKCDDSPHSIVKKNVVRNSNQRGYVIHGTNQVTIEDNVAFEVVGHCYFLEDASEEGNTFSGNLGLSVRNMPATGVSLLKQQTSTTITSDDSAAVFWISNPRNIFLNNVAAGSERFGFWFECRGETMTMTVTAFVNNEIHSTLGFGFTTYEPGWRPTQTAYFHNLKVYRTNGDGAFLHVAENLVFIGGLFADTGSKSVFNSRGDSVLFEGTKFIGFSGTAEPYILCTLGPKNIMGMLIDGTKMNEFDYAGMFVGTILRNVEFSHWSAAETGCGSGTTPFQVSTKQAFWPAFYNPHYFDNVNIIGDASTLRACEAIDFGINSVAIEIVSDTSASFSPAASPGFLVSSKISELIGGCSIYSGCLDFCANSCLQIVRFLTDASVPEGVEMVVTTSNGNQIRVERDIRGDETQIPHFFSIYVVALPADSIEISFIGSDGYTIVYPSFAVPVLEAPPECSNHLVVEDITIVRPLSGRDTCDDLIFNGDFDTGVSGWQGLNAGNTWSSQGGAEGTGALVTESRTNVLLNNPSQWIDTSCVEAGNTYILHLEYRNVNFAVPCQGIGLDCPNAQLVFSDFDPYTGEFVESLPRRVFETTESSPNGFTFSAIVDAWTPTAEEASSDRVQLQVTRGSGNIMIDNVHMRRMWGGNQILNGDFAAGSIDGVWHGFGNDIAIVQPGYNGYEGFALEATRNQGSANGMYQNVYNKYVNSETDLIKEGDEWLLSFHVRLFDGTTGNAIDCVPSLMDTTCPMVWVHTIHGETIPDGDQSVDQLFFDPEMSWDPNDWNTFETIITISEEDAADDLILYRLILNGGPVGAKLVVDDVSFTKRLRKIPSRLDFCGVNHITNGEFETGTTTGFYGWGNPIASYDPGYEGAGDFALAAIRPNHYSNGMWQDLFNSYKNPDNLQLCAQPGDVYRVKFKTRLLDATGQIGLACDPSLGDTNCPMVWVHTIRGVDLASGEQNIMEVFDTEMAWDANSWNSFDTTFTITEAQTGSNLLLFRIIFNGGPVGAQLVNDEIEVFMETLAPV